MPHARFDPLNAQTHNLLNEKVTPIHSKPPRLDPTLIICEGILGAFSRESIDNLNAAIVCM